MEKTALETRVIEEVELYWKAANPKKVYIDERVYHYLSGGLYVVAIIDEYDKPHENYVYVRGNHLHRYDDMRQLGINVGRDSLTMQMFKSMFEVAGISGAIAILITCTICWMALKGDGRSIPEYLSHAVTLVLGFYFGAKPPVVAK